MTKESQHGEPNVELMTIRSFDNEVEAELAKAKLESAGVESFLSGDDCGGMRPALTFTNGVKLIVRADQAARAADILGEENLDSR
jgi:hypothetical protein